MADRLQVLRSTIAFNVKLVAEGKQNYQGAIDALQSTIETYGLDKFDGVSALMAEAATQLREAEPKPKPNGPNGSPGPEVRKPGQKPPLTLIRANQIRIEELPKEFLIFNMLGRHEVSCWFGPPESGKSTVLIDACCHVALNHRLLKTKERPPLAFCGRKTMGGPVLYIAAERGRTVLRRIVAWAKRNNGGDRDFPLYVIDDAIDLRNNRVDLKRILEAVRAIKEAEGTDVVWIIFDTLSRILAGGDESSSKDMGNLVKHIDEMFRLTNAHITLVHHSPLGADRMRGWGGVNGALDTTVSIIKTAERVIVLEVEKASDLPEDLKPRLAFTIIPQIVADAQEIDGETIPETTAGVVKVEDSDKLPEKKAKRTDTNGSGKKQSKSRKPDGPVGTQQVRDALTEVLNRSNTKSIGSNNPNDSDIPIGVYLADIKAWREEAIDRMGSDIDQDAKSKRFRNSKQWLQDNKIIGVRGEIVWMVPKSAQQQELPS